MLDSQPLTVRNPMEPVTGNDPHAPLSKVAAAWLLAAANPVRAGAMPDSQLSEPEIGSVLHAAELHGVLSAVLRALRGPDAAIGTVESGQIAAIADARTRYTYQVGFQLLLTHHGERILAALHAAGSKAAIVKGPIFAQRLYAEPAMRSFTDIDILIPFAARDLASDILRGSGFKFIAREYRAGKDYCEDNWQLMADPRVGIEIHSNLVHNPNLRRTASITLGQVADAGNGSTNDATALLFVATAHGAISHQFDRLQHLVDVALAANGAAGTIDVERLSRVARTSGVLTAVHAALVLTGNAFSNACCLAMASALTPSILNKAASSLVTTHSVLAAQSRRRRRSSWRRKALRQAIRAEGFMPP